MKVKYLLIVFFLSCGYLSANILSPLTKYYVQYNVMVNVYSEFIDDRRGTDEDGNPTENIDTFSTKQNFLMPHGNVAIGMVLNKYLETEVELSSYAVHYTDVVRNAKVGDKVTANNEESVIKAKDSDSAYLLVDFALNNWRINYLTLKNLKSFVKFGVGVTSVNQPIRNFDGGRTPAFGYMVGAGVDYKLNDLFTAEFGAKYFATLPKRLETSAVGGSFVKGTFSHFTTYFGLRLFIN